MKIHYCKDSYNITPTEDLNGAGRFYLRFSNDTLHTTDALAETIQIYTLHHQNLLNIDGVLQPNAIATIIDLQGRTIATHRLNHTSTTQSIDVSHLGTGIYIVKINNNSNTSTKKVIIN